MASILFIEAPKGSKCSSRDGKDAFRLLENETVKMPLCFDCIMSILRQVNRDKEFISDAPIDRKPS